MLLSSYWSAFILYFILPAPATASSRPRDAAEARTRASSHRDSRKKKGQPRYNPDAICILSFSRMIQTRGWRWELQQRGQAGAAAASTPDSSPARCSGSIDVPAPAPHGRDSPPTRASSDVKPSSAHWEGNASAPSADAEGRHLNQVWTLPGS